MKLFREDNTEGYNEEEMDALNKEWEEIAQKKELEEGTEEWEFEAKAFCDKVSRR